MSTTSKSSKSVLLNKQGDPHWHWEEKDILPVARKLMGTLFEKDPSLRKLAVLPTCTAVVKSVGVWGDAVLNKRKGKYFLVYNLSLTIKWVGQIKVGEQVIGNARGRIHVTDITNVDNTDNPELQNEPRADENISTTIHRSNNNMKNFSSESLPVECYCEYDPNTHQRRDCNEVEEDVKKAIRSGPAISIVQNAIEHLCNGLFLEKKRIIDQEGHGNIGKSTNEGNSKIKGGAPESLKGDGTSVLSDAQRQVVDSKTKAYIDDLRRTTMQKKFTAVLEMLQGEKGAGVVEDLPKLCNLSYESLTDENIGELISAMTVCHEAGRLHSMKEIDLQNNNITDLGIQRLVTFLVSTRLKTLKRIRVSGNKDMTKLSRQILKGCSLMLPELKIVIEVDKDFRDVFLE